MCGIVGIVGHQPVASRLIDGLRRVEYRGYDSAGLAVLKEGVIKRCRASGKIYRLEEAVRQAPIDGPVGIAHTRWASHGIASETNAHPHITPRVAVVHNGIIENHASFRQALITKGVLFSSETDTEVVVHLVDQYLQQGEEPLQAVRKTLQKIEGAYALAFIFQGHPGLLIGARHGCPLAVGYGENEMYLGSDAISLSHLARRIAYLQDGDIAVLSPERAVIYDSHDNPAIRPIIENSVGDQAISKKEYPHFMLKEIYEQPDCVRATFLAYASPQRNALQFPAMDIKWSKVSRLTLVACGTAYYAALVGKYWFEQIARLPVEIDIASEFRYRMPPLDVAGVSLFVSQSGETADTLAAFQYAHSQGQRTLGIVNVPTSTLARSVDVFLTTQAGVEIGVASTKAFTTQLMCLALLALHVAYERGHLDQDQLETHLQDLSQVPSLLVKSLSHAEAYKEVAHGIKHASDTLFLGRGVSYAIALEGALKLKELSYIHAEGYAAGEMKHGPIALIDNKMPVIVVAPTDNLFDKTVSNIEETLARHGIVTLFSDSKGCQHFKHKNITTVEMPQTSLLTSSMVYSIPVQMLAYYAAVLRDTDVDQPRNLAKSVTIE